MTHRSSRRASAGTRKAALVAVSLSLLLAACGTAAAPSPTPSAAPTPTPVPGETGNVGGGGSGGSTGSGGAGGGAIIPPGGGILPGGNRGDPILGNAQLVAPQPNVQQPHPVSVVLIRAVVDGHHVTVELRWWSGVAPCDVLGSVKTDRTGTDLTLTPMEGSVAGDVACIDIAQLKATIVDLGDLDPGTYTIHASGNPEPTPVTITVS